jgi:endoglycosylceramidase
MKQSVGILLIIYLALLIAFCDGSANVHVSESFIIDDAGRIRIYHGVNFVNKGFPWYPPELLDPANVANLSQAGVNFIRLG